MTKPTAWQCESFADDHDRPACGAIFRWIDIRKRAVIRTAFAVFPPEAVIFDLGCRSSTILAAVSRPGDTATAALDLRLRHRGRRRHQVRSAIGILLPSGVHNVDDRFRQRTLKSSAALLRTGICDMGHVPRIPPAPTISIQSTERNPTAPPVTGQAIGGRHET